MIDLNPSIVLSGTAEFIAQDTVFMSPRTTTFEVRGIDETVATAKDLSVRLDNCFVVGNRVLSTRRSPKWTLSFEANNCILAARRFSLQYLVGKPTHVHAKINRSHLIFNRALFWYPRMFQTEEDVPFRWAGTENVEREFFGYVRFDGEFRKEIPSAGTLEDYWRNLPMVTDDGTESTELSLKYLDGKTDRESVEAYSWELYRSLRDQLAEWPERGARFEEIFPASRAK